MSKDKQLHVKGQTLPPSKLKSDFTQIPNAVLLDERLSFKARGILALLLSRPADWRIYLSEISERSSKDGKKAVQSGFKELVEMGYLALTAFVNTKNGQFEGKGYAICQKAVSHRQPHFRSVLKADSPKTGPSRNRIVPKTDSPKKALYSNTNSSNTNNRNIKKQQHQKAVASNVDDDVILEKMKKGITAFYPALLKDDAWQNLYLENDVGLSAENLYLLLRHFKNTSLKSGTTYGHLMEVKRHFANWYQINQSKKALGQFLQEGKKAEQRARAFLFPLIAKVNFYFDALLKRQCSTIDHVYEIEQKLIDAKEKLLLKGQFLSKSTERESIENLTADISKMLGKLKNAADVNQLDWFCLPKVSTQV